MKLNVDNTVRLADPKAAMACDYEGSRSAAIDLFCESCMGGQKSLVKGCKAFSCSLWKYRPGGEGKHVSPPKGSIPSKEELEKAIAKQPINEARKEWGKKLGAMRKAKSDETN